MVSCRECDQEVTEKAEFCPYCGATQSVPPGTAPEQQELALDIDSEGNVSEKPGAEDVPAPVESPEVEVIATGGQPNVSTDDLDEAPAAIPTGEPLEAAPDTAHVVTGETAPKRSSLKTLSEGTLLYNRYQIAKKIGGGGMGAVYLAFDQNLGGVERAVKEMVQSSIEEEQQTKAIDDFKRESTILSTLDHPAIPTIYDYFFDEGEGRFYLVMKYITGGDLAGRLRAAPAGKIEERQVTEWAIQVADVLAYLHGLPETIVYRDLKPSNIMLDGNTGRVMLIDFGIARAINQEEKGVTAVGTMGYAPPELFSGQVEPRSDIYSLGSTMFHLLTGADPQNNPLLIFDFQKNPRPRQINSQLSDQMERILMRAVEYNADHRFSSAEEMRQTLNAHLENLMRGNVTYGVSEAPAAVSLSSQLVFCGFCGQRIVASDMFCAFCGAKQPIAQQGVHAEIYPRTAATAKLIIDGTSELDMPVFTLEKNENLLGRRDPTANIFPEVDLSRFDPQTKISRRHARIWRDGGAFLVEDLGSSNGTVLIAGTSETVRLTPRMPHPLASGDRLRIGDTTLHFLMS
jgi:tRNA A-37 threonylcarbamoyl transferase component Bud32